MATQVISKKWKRFCVENCNVLHVFCVFLYFLIFITYNTHTCPFSLVTHPSSSVINSGDRPFSSVTHPSSSVINSGSKYSYFYIKMNNENKNRKTASAG